VADARRSVLNQVTKEKIAGNAGKVKTDGTINPPKRRVGKQVS
jgi:hypothetical protein